MVCLYFQSAVTKPVVTPVGSVTNQQLSRHRYNIYVDRQNYKTRTNCVESIVTNVKMYGRNYNIYNVASKCLRIANILSDLMVQRVGMFIYVVLVVIWETNVAE